MVTIIECYNSYFPSTIISKTNLTVLKPNENKQTYVRGTDAPHLPIIMLDVRGTDAPQERPVGPGFMDVRGTDGPHERPVGLGFMDVRGTEASQLPIIAQHKLAVFQALHLLTKNLRTKF